MRKIVFLVLAAALCAAAGAQSLPAAPTIRVSGEANIRVEADMATLNIGIVQQAKTAAELREALTKATEKVIASISALGIDKQNIRTSRFSISAVYDERPAKQRPLVGYRGDAGITVRLEDTGLAAQAIEAAMKAGANEIRSLAYGKKDEDSLRVEALKKAAAQAAEKAAALAETLGRKLGKAILIEESGYFVSAPESRSYAAKTAAAPEAFSPGSVEASASVLVVFEMQ